jgi:hypothetical protein
MGGLTFTLAGINFFPSSARWSIERLKIANNIKRYPRPESVWLKKT